MHPIFISIGPFTIHTYGVMMAIGFLASLAVAKRLAIADGLPVGKILDLAFWLLLIAFAGARVLFVITQWKAQYAADPLSAFKIWEGGLVFLGGPMAAIPYAAYYLRKHRLPVGRCLDVMIPGVVAGHIFGRLGCLASGCCYGRPTGTGFGIKLYSEVVEESHRGIFLHPTQLYEATGLGIILLGLFWVQKHKQFPGQVILTYLMAYSVMRSIIEVYRGDGVRGYVVDGVLSTSQFLSIGLFLAATVGMVMLARRANHERKAA